jgi:hypothetical protein
MSELLTDIVPPIGRVTLNRPDKRNALNSAMWMDLTHLAVQLSQDDRLRVVLLMGAGQEAFSAGAKSSKCLQLASGAVYLDAERYGEGQWVEVHFEKLDALESILNEAAGAPVLVAYHFKSDLARLQRAFPKGRVLDSDPNTIRQWNKGDIPLLFAHPASAGHGLKLQDGGNIIVFG